MRLLASLAFVSGAYCGRGAMGYISPCPEWGDDQYPDGRCRDRRIDHVGLLRAADFSKIGCDENGDGLIRYEGVPAGDYLVDQVQPAAGYVTVHDIPITVAASPATQTFTIRLDPVGGGKSQASSGERRDRFTSTHRGSNQFAITDVCYVLVDPATRAATTTATAGSHSRGSNAGTGIHRRTQTAGPMDISRSAISRSDRQ